MARRLIGNIKGPKGDTGAQGPKGATGPQGPAGPTGVVDTNTPVTFTEAATDTDIASGDTLGVIAGKLRKSIKTLRAGLGTLSTLKTTAKTNAVAAINELKDLITSLTTDVSTLNSNLENKAFSYARWLNGNESLNFGVELNNTGNSERPVFFVLGNIGGGAFINFYNISPIPSTITEISPSVILPCSNGLNISVKANKHALGIKSLRVQVSAAPGQGCQVCVLFPSGGALIDEW